MPEETIRAVQDHGEIRGDTVAESVKKAHKLLEKIAAVGVDYDDVTETLELEGVQKFADSFEELLEGVRSKRGQLAAA
jgi:transaldolase